MKKNPIKSGRNVTAAAISLLLSSPVVVFAQVPVDENGNAIGTFQSQAEVMSLGDDGVPKLSTYELQELVGPVALYPDDLLAIVLPASAYPLQIAAAVRFVDALETDPSLQPDPEWDDSVVALVNYPEVVELLNNDLDWTYRLGEAVIAQQTDVVAAVESFRDRAYAAGNLKSDAYQTVSNDEGVIEISPSTEDVIYVPYYEPARVIVYQPRPAYYYYPRPYPVYYYPYASGHYFDRGRFWGVTTAFTIGWRSDSLHVYHHSYRGHPYFGRSYRDNWWYRRPSINVYNTTYINNRTVTVNRYNNGDRWHPRENRREYVREGYARDGVRASRSQAGAGGLARRNIVTRTPAASRTTRQSQRQVAQRQAEPIRFRDRGGREIVQSRDRQSRDTQRVARSNRDTTGVTRQQSRQQSQQRSQQTVRREETRQARPAPTPKVRPQIQPQVRQEPQRQSRQSTPRQTRPAPTPKVRPQVRQQQQRQPQQQSQRRQEPARQSRSAQSRQAPTPSTKRAQPSRSEPSSRRQESSQRSRGEQRRR